MKSILHQQGQGRERGNATRPTGAHAPAGDSNVRGRGTVRPLLAPASNRPWNLAANRRLGINAGTFTPHAPHVYVGVHSGDRALVPPEVPLPVLGSTDPQDGCEEGCPYCDGPETD